MRRNRDSGSRKRTGTEAGATGKTGKYERKILRLENRGSIINTFRAWSGLFARVPFSPKLMNRAQGNAR
jgi:hypothetical protein